MCEQIVRETLGREPRRVVRVDDGWDFEVLLVDGEWVFRFPRRPEPAEALEMETVLLPALAETLPVAVPRFEYVRREPEPFVAYRLIDGEPMRDEDPEGVAAFLSALHRFDASALPVPRPDWRAVYERRCTRLAETVLPLLDRDERRRAEPLLAQAETLEGFAAAVTHSDLGPDHLRCREGRLVGVIDWGDTRIGDPAIDLAWLLHAHPRAEEILAAYTGPADDAFRERALFYHRLGPWYEVDRGVRTGQPRFVESGLAGIRARLP